VRPALNTLAEDNLGIVAVVAVDPAVAVDTG